jgi:aminoglycoside phosphotransferase (APT) family kinase protein
MTPDTEKLKDILSLFLEKRPENIVLSRFQGGYSNLSYLLRTEEDRCLVLRTAPAGINIKAGHDMHREFTVLQKIKTCYAKVPEVYYFSNDHSVTGADFFIMEYVDGFILRAGLPAEHLPTPPNMQKMADAFLDNLVSVHQIDVHTTGLINMGNIEGFVGRQMNGWLRRYQEAAVQEVKGIEKLIRWLSDHSITGAGKPVWIHNDYKYDNIIYDPEYNVKAVLDWEMSTIGEPLIDLGCSLAYWADPEDPDWFIALQLNMTTLPGNYRREEVLHHYALKTGSEPGSGVFLYAFGLFKLAVIAQQIYRRYTVGKTTDGRFAHLDKAVQACVSMANQAVNLGRISNLFTV